MSSPDVEKIRSILKEHGRLSREVETLAAEADLYQAGMTSHASVNVMLALEGEFDVEFPDHMLKRNVFNSIASIRAAVDELTACMTCPRSHARTFARVDGHHREPLSLAWELCSTPADSALDPVAIGAAGAVWLAGAEPGTAAASLRRVGRWTPRRPAAPLRRRGLVVPLPLRRSGRAARRRALVLGFDGLATVADVWLNGEPLLASDNMFVGARSASSRRALRGATTSCCCASRALDAAQAKRRPRPRWRAPMIEHQQLRWFRTTLLGRTPGWSPPAAAVGPWRDVWLERRAARRDLAACALHARSMATAAVVELWRRRRCPHGDAASTGARAGARARRATHRTRRSTLDRASTAAASARLRIDAEPRCGGRTRTASRRCTTRTSTCDLEDAGGRRCTVDLGSRRLSHASQVDTHGGDFALRVNGVPVFCRGACWTPLDVVALQRYARGDYAMPLAQVRDAGMNMLRVGGTMVYESDDFFDACDELRHPGLAGLHVRQHGLSRTTTRLSSPRSRSRGRAAARAAGSARACARRAVRQQRGRAAGRDVGRAARALEPAAVPRRSLARRCARELAPACRTGRRARTAARSRIRPTPAPPRTTASAPTCGRSTTRAAPTCASRPSAWPSPTCPRRHARRACPAAWRCACTTRRGRRARRATSAPAGTSTTCATTTSTLLFGVDPARAALRRSRALPARSAAWSPAR